MADYTIKCEAIRIRDGRTTCPGSAGTTLGETHLLGATTPAGICARAWQSIYPAALAMRFSEEIPWEQGKGYFDINCPDSHVVFRLSRLKHT